MAARSNSSGGVWRVVFWIALVVCLAAVAALGFIVYSYWSANQGYEEIAEVAFTPADVEAQQGDAPTTLGEMTVDWDYLRSINPDYAGDTNVDKKDLRALYLVRGVVSRLGM